MPHLLPGSNSTNASHPRILRSKALVLLNRRERSASRPLGMLHPLVHRAQFLPKSLTRSTIATRLILTWVVWAWHRETQLTRTNQSHPGHLLDRNQTQVSSPNWTRRSNLLLRAQRMCHRKLFTRSRCQSMLRCAREVLHLATCTRGQRVRRWVAQVIVLLKMSSKTVTDLPTNWRCQTLNLQNPQGLACRIVKQMSIKQALSRLQILLKLTTYRRIDDPTLQPLSCQQWLRSSSRSRRLQRKCNILGASQATWQPLTLV